MGVAAMLLLATWQRVGCPAIIGLVNEKGMLRTDYSHDFFELSPEHSLLFLCANNLRSDLLPMRAGACYASHQCNKQHSHRQKTFESP